MDRYAVVGNPVAHSKSPLIHAEFAAQTGQELHYEALLAPLDGFAATVAAFRAAGGRGLNVTAPFKLEAFELADRLSPRAEAAGAVNTLAFDGGQAYGDNTDGAGLVRDLTHNLGRQLAGRRVLLLGAGGAARGAILPLLMEGPASLVIANRTESRALELADRFRAGAGDAELRASSFAGLAGSTFDLVINATAASLSAQSPELPPGVYAPGALAYDMMYGKGDTAFMRAARADGAAAVADGLGMLVEQAAESFQLWRGVRPQTTSVLADLRASIDRG
ncbi:shikimate dehydrogenase [Thauera sp. CAU 1555]|uniref:Shikimate dehydrogenase (NADP(+)) n=1 Tax=Thauera sedimentorum TaxID=2767595 RepID=A0ABR9B516_9RHOO|nr:shikimate dehydrogenase [Thauera sedimentorum]MBC9070346.1 shikimate dehydrogenase [Thauera sedimentorum]MBD8501266.1 shikimate dehydrogenase [Thauera sedimentorum]